MSHTNKYRIEYLVNRKDGTWDGPYDASIIGKTMMSAWVDFLSIVLYENSKVRFLSLINWKVEKNKDKIDPKILALTFQTIHQKHL